MELQMDKSLVAKMVSSLAVGRADQMVVRMAEMSAYNPAAWLVVLMVA